MPGVCYIQNAVLKQCFEWVGVLTLAKQIEGVYESVLACAREEFLARGFERASLRQIAQNAGTSTGSIYTRFGDKHGLFDALVADPAQNLIDWFRREHEAFAALSPAGQRDSSFRYSDERMPRFIDYVYDHYDAFKLLLTCAEGTRYKDFVHEFVLIDVQYTLDFIRAMGSDVLASARATMDFIHMLSSAFFTGILETIVHDMPREEAIAYTLQIQRFYQAGWKNLLRL